MNIINSPDPILKDETPNLFNLSTAFFEKES